MKPYKKKCDSCETTFPFGKNDILLFDDITHETDYIDLYYKEILVKQFWFKENEYKYERQVNEKTIKTKCKGIICPVCEEKNIIEFKDSVIIKEQKKVDRWDGDYPPMNFV